MSNPHPDDSHNDEDEDEDEEDYYLAPQSQRAFSAGIKRKRIDFVPASTSTTESVDGISVNPPVKSDAGAKYLSIVLGSRSQSKSPSQSQSQPESRTSSPIPSNLSPSSSSLPSLESETEICAICSAPVTASTRSQHESSIAHQLGLEHSHPPSHLDRQRKGLRYLEGYGWDPDSRLGLGARSEGIRVPVKAREKRDTAGLGLFTALDREREEGAGRKKRDVVRREERVVGLNAKQTRRVEDEKKRKAEKLRRVFYGEDLSQYLGPDG